MSRQLQRHTTGIYVMNLPVIQAEFKGHLRYQLYLSLDAPPGNGTCSQKDNIALLEKASEPIRDWECRGGGWHTEIASKHAP
jgi:hypothetical protein